MGNIIKLKMMKKITLLAVLLLSVVHLSAQDLVGAWEREYIGMSDETLKTVAIFSDSHYVFTTYDANTGKFLSTNGGIWAEDGAEIRSGTIEFDTEVKENVGTQSTYIIQVQDSVLELVNHDVRFKKIDNGQPGKLQGAWLMSGRVVNGESQQRATDGPRKTMKILSGTRFQWIAYNTETKEFMGTGGGTYSTENGIYIENIDFFSKDASRVGASLDFKYELKNGDWYHSGLSSKGNPINEIWSLRE